jgi:uncharacterized protein YjbJ (UPF0337 family)
VATDKTTPSADQIKGSVAEAIGKLTGDPKVEAAGRRKKEKAPPDKVRRATGDGPDRD